MFKMVEVVGVSSQSFSDAAKRAVKQLSKNGSKVSWFEVAEQRGAMNNGEVQFQVKIKAGVAVAEDGSGVDDDASADDEAICPTCHKVITGSGHMCSPLHSDAEQCEWCGETVADARHLCSDKTKELTYICNSCGRTAISSESLCDPKKI